MRKSLLAFGLALLLFGSAQAQPVVVPATTAQVSIAGTVAVSTKIVSGIAGKSIYVTAVALVPVATSVVTFTTGTGTNCGTGTANITGVMTFTSMVVFTLGDGYGAVWVLPSGNDLCITIATAASPGSLAYSQF